MKSRKQIPVEYRGDAVWRLGSGVAKKVNFFPKKNIA